MSDLSSAADLAYATTAEVAETIQKKEISSREAVDYFLARVESLDKTINSVVTIDAERARAEADAADAALARGEGQGALHGVPMTIKDSYQTKGMRTTSGAPELKDFIPEEDAWPVALPGCAQPGPLSTARPIYRSTLVTCKAITRFLARPIIRTIRRARRAARPAAREPPWPVALRRSSSGAISAVRFGYRPICPA